jgi:mannose-6-phosphate isomerase-like protein (cupin superfamily)
VEVLAITRLLKPPLRSVHHLAVVTEARLELTEHGLIPTGQGWFVLNARDARWHESEGRGVAPGLQGRADFAQLGIGLNLLRPGEPMAMYHWETDQEDFLVLAGEALFIIEGEEKPLRQWDFVHCPPGTRHVIVGAGEGLCVVFAVGALENHTVGSRVKGTLEGRATGAHTPSTRPRFAMVLASRRRRTTRTSRTRGFRSANRRRTATAGCPDFD